MIQISFKFKISVYRSLIVFALQILHHFRRKKNMRDHRNRIKEMISFIEIKYPTYALQVINEISESDLQNDRYHWFGAKKDFDYEKMHPDIIKAFMATKKVKRFKLPKSYSAQVRALQRNPEQKDRIMSYEHIRKFHDAMLFGASEKGVNLSGTYLIEMKKFLDNYKKEVASKKKKGLLMKAIQILLLSHYIAWLQTGSLRKIIFLVGCS